MPATIEITSDEILTFAGANLDKEFPLQDCWHCLGCQLIKEKYGDEVVATSRPYGYHIDQGVYQYWESVTKDETGRGTVYKGPDSFKTFLIANQARFTGKNIHDRYFRSLLD